MHEHYLHAGRHTPAVSQLVGVASRHPEEVTKPLPCPELLLGVFGESLKPFGFRHSTISLCYQATQIIVSAYDTACVVLDDSLSEEKTMKLRAKVNQVVEGTGKKSGQKYTKVKVTVEEGNDSQTCMLFWNDALGKLPAPGDQIWVDFSLAASEFGDLMLKASAWAPVAVEVKKAA